MKLNKLTFIQKNENSTEFKDFVKLFKKKIKAQLEKQQFELIKFNNGHFCISGFFKDVKENLYYFSWNNGNKSILYRTAVHLKDWTGGNNNWTLVNNFKINNLY